jgi:hypothetical protein
VLFVGSTDDDIGVVVAFSQLDDSGLGSDVVGAVVIGAFVGF